MIKRVALMSTVLVMIIALAPSPQAASGTSDVLTRLQVRVSTSSEWTTVRLGDVKLRAARTVSQTSTSALFEKPDGWTVVRSTGAPSSTAVFDVIAEVSETGRPTLVVTKGRGGVSTVEVLSSGATQAAPIARVELATQDPHHNAATTALPPDLLLGAPLAIPEVDDRNLALAFYYPWFHADTTSDSRVNPDKPGSWYATENSEHLRGMLAEAAGAGLDGFIVSWEGPLHGNVVDRLMAEVGRQPGFTVAPLLELRAMRTKTLLGDRFDPAVVAAALKDFERRVPAGSRLQVAGRPVVAAFGMWDLSPSDWAAFLALLGEQRPFIVGDRLDPAFALDGHYQYDPNDRSISQLEHDYEHAVNRARLQPALDPAQRHLLWAATVSPGFDNTASTLVLGRRFTDRAGGWRYDQTWRVALDSRPEWVFVTSWNEWWEQTHISPGRSTGRAALDQTSRWTQVFHAAGQ